MIRDMPSDDEVEIEKARYADIASGTSSVRLSFAARDGKIFLVSSGKNSRWPSEILRTGYASLIINGAKISGSTTLLSDENSKSCVLSLFTDKYWEDYVRHYYSMS
jgi:hypothetical protein